MSNAFAKLFNQIDLLATGKDEAVPADIPCRAEILAMRQCIAESADGVRNDAIRVRNTFALSVHVILL